VLGASLATSPAGLNASKFTFGAAGKRLWCRLRAHAGYVLCLLSVLLSAVQGEKFWRELSQRSTAGEGPGEHSRGMGSGQDSAVLRCGGVVLPVGSKLARGRRGSLAPLPSHGHFARVAPACPLLLGTRFCPQDAHLHTTTSWRESTRPSALARM